MLTTSFLYTRFVFVFAEVKFFDKKLYDFNCNFAEMYFSIMLT